MTYHETPAYTAALKASAALLNSLISGMPDAGEDPASNDIWSTRRQGRARTMTVNRERLQLGIDALRSGQYEQGTGALHIRTGDTDEWCCLGVLSDVAARNGLTVARRSAYGQEYFDSNPSFLCERVRDWYGLPAGNPPLTDGAGYLTSAAILNDEDGGRASFADIADAFTRTYLKGSS